ncbi:MAG: molybdopterin molybdotransferase MoeA [Rhodobiaceae bacterium]|nr:molybdopterin molybdotransferase MoeA [Rhodobiaceae bacterium]
MTAGRALLDDCFLHDKDRLRHHEVEALLRDRLHGICDTETVPLAALSGRILARDLTARVSVPPRDNAAVDGYAFANAAYLECGGRLAIAQRIQAGSVSGDALESGTAARIFTGAFLPDGADTVAMQEDCVVEGDMVVVPEGLKPGANRRLAGEDMMTGDGFATAGTRLDTADVAAIAAQGIASADCYKPLRIAVFSTGDELLEPGEEPRPGRIFDSNRAMLFALVDRWPGVAIDCGRLPDEAGAVRAALEAAARDHDVIVTTGGAGRGEADHIVMTLEEIGKRHLWQLAIKPGRPLTVGQIGPTPLFGLPGNPVAVFVCALLYLRPALHLLSGGQWPEAAGYMIPSATPIRKKPDRREFLRGTLVREAGVVVGVEKYKRDGSGLISGLRAADGLIELAEDITEIGEGDPVLFRPFGSYGLD